MYRLKHKLVALIAALLLLTPFSGASVARAANTLTIALDPTLVTGPIPAGAPTYIFAAFKLTAGDTPVSITSLKVVSDSASRSEFRNIGVYKDGNQFVGTISPTLTNGSATYTFSPAITIAAGSTTLLETSASLTNQANGNMRLGLDGFVFSGTAPTVGQTLPFYGNNVPVSGGSGAGTETLTATATPAACGTTVATVSLSVQGNNGTTYTVKKGTATIATIVGSGTTSDTVNVGASNTYMLYSGSTQVGTSQTVTGTQAAGCGGATTATLSATVTPAACTATSAVVNITVQGTSGTTYIVQRNGSNYVTFIGSGSVADSVAIGSANTYTLWSNGAQIGNAQSATGTKLSSCGGSTVTGTLSAAVTPAPCGSTSASVAVTLQGTAGVTYTIKKNGTDFASFTGSGSTADTVAVGATNTYTLFSGGQQIGGSQTATGTQAAGCTSGSATLTVVTTPASCTATTATVTISVQGTNGIAYVIKKNNADFATISGSGQTSDTIAIGASNTYALFTGGQQVGTSQTVTGARQAGCTTTGTLTITSPDSLPDGTVGQRYSTSLTATGGTAPYTWTMQNGQFNLYPCCYTNLSAAGVFSSLDSAASIMPYSGTYQLPVKVTDAAGATAQKTLQFTIKPASTTTIQISEGYLDGLSANLVSGWAYKTKTDGSTPQISITFENIANSALVFTLNLNPSIVRADVAGYLQNKYGASIGQTPTGFTGSPASVITTNGTYRIRTAAYDSTPFVLSDAAKQTFVVGQATTGPTGKYVKVDGDPTVYWVTIWGGKMPILTAQVFQSYGGRWEDVVVVTQEALDAYDDVDYIRLQGNARVYKIANGVKQYLTPAAATRLNIDPGKVVTVNATEFYTYKTGKSIQ